MAQATAQIIDLAAIRRARHSTNGQAAVSAAPAPAVAPMMWYACWVFVPFRPF